MYLFDPILINSIIIIFVYAVPLYVANSVPVIIHGKTPLDFNKMLWGSPLFGKGKTIIGTLSGITSGTLIGAIIALIFPYILVLIPNYIEVAFYLALGAILGDLVKSFFKRRFKIKNGEKWDLADQLDFILGGLVLSSIALVPEYWVVIVLFIATFFIHKFTNWIAYIWKLKKVPW